MMNIESLKIIFRQPDLIQCAKNSPFYRFTYHNLRGGTIVRIIYSQFLEFRLTSRKGGCKIRPRGRLNPLRLIQVIRTSQNSLQCPVSGVELPSWQHTPLFVCKGYSRPPCCFSCPKPIQTAHWRRILACLQKFDEFWSSCYHLIADLLIDLCNMVFHVAGVRFWLAMLPI